MHIWPLIRTAVYTQNSCQLLRTGSTRGRWSRNNCMVTNALFSL